MKPPISRLSEFLKPSINKLFFLVEWVLLILYEWVMGELNSRSLPVALLPLAFFYLVASGLSALSRHTQQIAQGYRLHLIALGLTLADQVLKIVVILTMPHQTSLPIIWGWLHIANERNLRGSWLVETLDLSFVSTGMLVVFILLFLVGALIGHGFYTSHKRKSAWADVAYLGLFSGLLSALCDLILRGYTLDFIQIPDIVTADLKDVLLTIGLAAFFVEIYENPDISLRWKGWHQEAMARRQLITELLQYVRQECMWLWSAIRRK